MVAEQISGVVDRVTYHNPDNGWSVLKVTPFDGYGKRLTVLVHQTRVFAGATMAFWGSFIVHPRYGRQFKATKAVEKKPASAAALEKYLGSGLIKGVGPKTAKKIVAHFRDQTLDVFETDMARLLEVPGIAHKKLSMISKAWLEHRAVRDVMMFLQSHGISTLFAVRIYKEYGDDAIARVAKNPYGLADDFYGIGFFTADKVALSMGMETDSPRRIMAGIRHVLSGARNFGHCYLTFSQIKDQVAQLLNLPLGDNLLPIIEVMEADRLLMKRVLTSDQGLDQDCYYARSLFFDELYTARRIRQMTPVLDIDIPRMKRWMDLFCKTVKINLSPEQRDAVQGIAGQAFAILTGGPGCGKTTTTKVLVRLLEAMGCKVLLAAPTGRAAQRMGQVTGKPAKTIHRLLGWQGTRFKKNEENPLKMDVLVVDETSMLDISLTAALLKAVPEKGRVVFIGDDDQLPPVGAGNVLKDLMASGQVACFRLTKIFRQAAQSLIIKYAHQINAGKIPWIRSPFNRPEIWQNGEDCLFLDSDEATGEQIRFVKKVKRAAGREPEASAGLAAEPDPSQRLYEFRVEQPLAPYETEIRIPEKFAHVCLDRLLLSSGHAEELKAVVKNIHPWSSLHYGLTAQDVVRQLYLEWIPKYHGKEKEIQILSPMTRGSMGTVALNRVIQEAANPPMAGKPQIQAGQRIFRIGDRVIHRKNNYTLGVFNGDIGQIRQIDPLSLTLTVRFFPDNRDVFYQQADIMELDLAYAVTIHKSQGSEFEVVIIPVLTQHFTMLYRNLIYTGVTRARKLAVFVGSRRALALAVKNEDISLRQTALAQLLEQGN